MLCCFSIVAGCDKKVPEPEPPEAVEIPEAKSADEPEEKAPPREVKTLESEDLKKGSGKLAETGDTVKVHYTGKLLDGTKFDSSLDRDQPFEFTLGKSEVIKGWDDGVVGMKEGGKRRLLIPYVMAYGERGRPPKIPPKSPLEFEIELLSVTKQKK